MSRYTGPVCRLCRAEGAKLFLKGDRCYTEKCGLTKRNSKPGQHGTRRGKQSEYGIRLREKQKLRRFYGINETQFSTIYEKATGMAGQTGHNFLQLLERRLDNVVYRLGFGVSRAQVGKYLSGATGYFDDATWRRISPILSPYVGEISNCPFWQDNHCRLTGQNPDMIRLIELISAMSELERAELLVTVLKQAAPQKENQ